MFNSPESFDALQVALTEVTGEDRLLCGGLVFLPVVISQAVGLIVSTGLLLEQVCWLHVGVWVVTHPPRSFFNHQIFMI